VHHCVHNGTYLECRPPDRMNPAPDMKECEGYKDSGNEAFCKYAFDPDGMCTDICQCPAVRQQAREVFDTIRKARLLAQLPCPTPRSIP